MECLRLVSRDEQDSRAERFNALCGELVGAEGLRAAARDCGGEERGEGVERDGGEEGLDDG